MWHSTWPPPTTLGWAPSDWGLGQRLLGKGMLPGWNKMSEHGPQSLHIGTEDRCRQGCRGGRCRRSLECEQARQGQQDPGGSQGQGT